MTCAVIFGAVHAVMFAKEGTIATETAKILHFQNVFAKEGASEMHMMPFSMEDLMKKDPDILFLTTMVTPGQGEKVFLEESLLTSPPGRSCGPSKKAVSTFSRKTSSSQAPASTTPKPSAAWPVRCIRR